MLSFGNATGDGEFFFWYFEAPVDVGDEFGLFVLNISGEFVGENFGVFKLDTTDSGGDDKGDGEFFFWDFEASVDVGDELGLFVLNISGEFVDDNFGAFKLDTTDSGEDKKGACLVFDNEWEAGSHRK